MTGGVCKRGDMESETLRMEVHKQMIMAATGKWISCAVVLRDLLTTMESPHESDQRADQYNEKADE